MPNIAFDTNKLSPEEAVVITGILEMKKAIVENAVDAVETISRDRIIKYYFGIKE